MANHSSILLSDYRTNSSADLCTADFHSHSDRKNSSATSTDLFLFKDPMPASSASIIVWPIPSGAYYRGPPSCVLPFQDIGPPFCRVPGRSRTSVSYSVSGKSGSDTYSQFDFGSNQTHTACSSLRIRGSRLEGRLPDFLCGYASLGFNAPSFDLSVERPWIELYSPRRWPAKEVILTD